MTLIGDGASLLLAVVVDALYEVDLFGRSRFKLVVEEIEGLGRRIADVVPVTNVSELCRARMHAGHRTTVWPGNAAVLPSKLHVSKRTAPNTLLDNSLLS